MTNPERNKHAEVPPAWLIRAGKHGEREDTNIEEGVASVGWDQLPDLTGISNRDEIVAIISDALPEASKNQIANYTAQVWAMRAKVRVGDLVVLPRKKTSQLALGIVTRGYWYRNIPDSDTRPPHVVSVDWKRTDVPRTAVKQDLLYSLGAFLTLCSIKRNDARWRLHQLLLTGQDPGARVVPTTATMDDAVHSMETVARRTGNVVDTSDNINDGGTDPTDSDGLDFDLERLGRDQIQAHIAEHFAGHELGHLVAEILRSEGFFTEESPAGPDGGIDVFAGRGPLGLDSPRLIVQVKSSPTPLNVKIVRELNGVLSAQNADQGLLVAWGGLNRSARRELRDQFFRVRVWDADDLIDAVFRNHDKLSEEIRAGLPLKRIWSLAKD